MITAIKQFLCDRSDRYNNDVDGYIILSVLIFGLLGILGTFGRIINDAPGHLFFSWALSCAKLFAVISPVVLMTCRKYLLNSDDERDLKFRIKRSLLLFICFPCVVLVNLVVGSFAVLSVGPSRLYDMFTKSLWHQIESKKLKENELSHADELLDKEILEVKQLTR